MCRWAPQIRALQVEMVIEKLRTKCKNEPLGCEYRGDGGPDDRRSHESRCELNDQENAQDATRRPSRGAVGRSEGKVWVFRLGGILI